MQPTVRTRVLVRDVMNSPVVVSSPDASVSEVAKKMIDFKVGSVVIMQNDKPAGIVTDGDIVSKVVAKNLKPNAVFAKHVMTNTLHTIEAGRECTQGSDYLLESDGKFLCDDCRAGIAEGT